MTPNEAIFDLDEGIRLDAVDDDAMLANDTDPFSCLPVGFDFAHGLGDR